MMGPGNYVFGLSVRPCVSTCVYVCAGATSASEVTTLSHYTNVFVIVIIIIIITATIIFKPTSTKPQAEKLG